jgi:predicted RNase H-like nuclease (RuvC/YqgF family)
MTTADTMNETVISMLKDMQRSIDGQLKLSMQIFRNGERVEKRVDVVDRRLGEINRRFDAVDQRIGNLDQRVDETNERISDLKDELSLMLKMELSGWAANFETRLDQRLERIENRLDSLARHD